MKISGVSSIALQPANTRFRAQPTSGAGGSASRVSLSSQASWIQELQAGAEGLTEPRMDLVNEIRASLADGSFEQSVDMESVLSGLMGDL